MNPDTITFASIKRVDNGYVVQATNAARELQANLVFACLDDAVDAIAGLPWAGEGVE